MYIHGHFYNEHNERIEVHILTLGDRTKEVEIGAEGSGLDWTDDPVDITSEVNDTFDVLLRSQASVRLLTKNFVPDFFCASCRDAVVNIYREGKCLFAGFVEPQTYSQGYNEEQDEVELSCIDVLTALQYAKYGNVGAPGVLYSVVKSSANQRTMLDIIREIMEDITVGLDIKGGHALSCLYDGSRAVDSLTANRHSVLGQISVGELLFLGSDEDEVWQQDEVLEEILKYLNLHIVQEGFTFYIFSWDSIKSNADISWHNILNNNSSIVSTKTIEIKTDIVAGCNTAISIGEVYNRLLINCKVENIESVIESPLDDESLIPLFDNKQKYVTEYSSDGEGKKAYKAFHAMTHDLDTDYGGGRITDWFIRVKDNPSWIFPDKNESNGNLIDWYRVNKINQHDLPNILGRTPGALLLAMGSVEKNTAKKDNSPTSKVNMTDYLVVSVNGNGKDKEEECFPNADDIRRNIPYAVYSGNSVGGVFSPADDDSTNYIVLSGRIILNPLMRMTATYKELHTLEDWGDDFWHMTVPSRTNSDGRYYTRQYWKALTPATDTLWDDDTDYGLIPFAGNGPEEYEFKYSAIGDSTDKVSKIAALACMLIIGEKCVVETGTDGQPSDFKWRRYKSREECGSDDEYYQQSFTIGFDPKIGDKLIGTEYDIQNNISYTLGIDAEGTAIPIRKDDKVSGRVRFFILGPVNTVWDEYTRRHPTFFRHTKWSSKSVPLLSHVSNILLKSFEVKVYSDNGRIDSTDDNDIIYMSDTAETFLNQKDDIQFRIHSALTSAECRELGVTNTVKKSVPVNIQTGEGLLAIYDHVKGVLAKPEQLYVDSFYREYHQPRVIMEQEFMDTDDVVGLFNHYIHPAMKDKIFFVQGISRNLTAGTANVTIKEIDE